MAFSELSQKDPKTLLGFYETDLYYQFEKGLISAQEFRDSVNQWLGSSISQLEFDDAWNAMLLDIPEERISLIKKLADSHNLYLISNTNEIHVPCFNAILESSTGHTDLKSLFINTYYSHEIKMRKPDVEIYYHVIEQNNLDPVETVMIDDREDNLQGAKEAGLNILQVSDSYTILDHFS